MQDFCLFREASAGRSSRARAFFPVMFVLSLPEADGARNRNRLFSGEEHRPAVAGTKNDPHAKSAKVREG